MSNKYYLTKPENRIVGETSSSIGDFLSGSILRQPSSVELGWRNFVVERRTILPSELPELVLEQHFLILWDAHVAEGERAYKGGRFSPYRKHPGTITTCHPGLRPSIRNTSSHEVVVASIEADLVNKIEDELDERPTGSLRGLYGTEDQAIRNIILLLLRESEAGGPCGTLYSESLTTALVMRLLYAARLERPLRKTVASALSNRVLRRVVELMQVDLSSDLNLSALATESGYSRSHFIRTFKAATGQTPHRYLLELRLQRAGDLLVDQSLPLTDIAASCGLSSHGHLTTAFRSRFGVPPSHYRREDTRRNRSNHVPKQ